PDAVCQGSRSAVGGFTRRRPFRSGPFACSTIAPSDRISIPGALPGTRPVSAPVERWLSGRKRRFAKPVTGVNLVHGFESRPLRSLPVALPKFRSTAPNCQSAKGLVRMLSHRSKIVWLGLFALLAASANQSAAQAQVTLRYKFKEGEKLHYNLEQKMKMEMNV